MASDDPMDQPLDPADRRGQPGHPAGADDAISAGEVLGGRSWQAGGSVDDADDERDIREDTEDEDEDDDVEPSAD